MKRLLALGALALVTASCEALLGDLDHTYRDVAAGGMGGSPSEGGGGSAPGVGGGGGEPILGACGTPLGTPIDFAYASAAGVAAQWCFLETATTQTEDALRFVDGVVRIVPGATMNDYWHLEHTAPFVYTELQGDFGFYVAFSVEANEARPCRAYNGGGILVRDPSALPDWLLFDLSRFPNSNPGAQDCGSPQTAPTDQGVFGTHVFSYDDIVGENFSAAENHSIEMGVCRIGQQFEMYTRGATAAQTTPTSVLSAPITRSLSTEVEVGITAHRYVVTEELAMEIHAARVEPNVTSFEHCRDTIFPNASL